MNDLIQDSLRDIVMRDSSSPRLWFLIADDSASFCRVLRQIVESHSQWGVAAEVHDGKAAVQWVQLYSPDIVLMDIVMPVVNGIHAARQIKQNTPAVRIITFSAYHEEEFRMKALQAGADYFIWKEELTETSLEQMVESIRP